MTKIGDTISGSQLGKRSGRYIYTECIDCKTKRWLTLVLVNAPNFIGRCKSCYHKNLRGKNHTLWKGGRFKTIKGYICVHARDSVIADKKGYALEHRLVALEKYGINAIKNMDVHHIDYDKTNNSPDNLELLTRSSHRKIHRKFFKCQLSSCDNEHYGLGLCSKHYHKQRRRNLSANIV